LLISLFRVCVKLSYHSNDFNNAHIIIFKKSNKKNYSNVKVYKFIALLNILNKALEFIITRRINDLTKINDMFFVSQMRKQKNRNCDTTLKLLIEQIHTIWNMRKEKMMILLNINVINVYDYVSRERLLHNSRKQKISIWMINWTNNFMRDKHTSLIIDNFTMISRLIKIDISQKFFISSILYFFYNANLL
jgi:hypothetical protein